MTARNYSNTGSDAQVAVLISAVDTSVALANYSGFPSDPYIAALDPDTADEEIVLVTDVVGSTVTMTRGYDGTTAKAHAAGAVFRHVASAKDFQEANDHIQATSGVHGVTSALVGTTDTQTLTNKTLTAPTITSPTVTGTLNGASAAFSGSVTVGSVSGSTATVTDLTVTDALSVGGASTVAALDATDVTVDTLGVSGAATVGGTLGVTGALTGAGATFTGTVTGATVDADLGILDEVELVQTASDLTAAASRASLWAKTDSGLHFRPNGQNRRRVAMSWPSGSTLPTTGAIAGDTFYHTGLSSMLRYNGTNWRQIDGPVEIANMAARPTHADLHAGFQVFSLVDDDVYTYDGTYWKNALAQRSNRGFAGITAGDYITGVAGTTQSTTLAGGYITITPGPTFDHNIVIGMSMVVASGGFPAAFPSDTGATTSSFRVYFQTASGAAAGPGVTARCDWIVWGYSS